MATSVSSLISTGLAASSGTSGSSTSGSGTSTGLGQGINVNSFVQLALAGDTTDLTNLQTQQTAVGAETSALSTITSNLTALQTATSALNDPFGVFSEQTATSSDPSLLTGTATSSAVEGTHTIDVTSLATTSSYYTDEVASSSTALATGDTINISEGGNSAASVTVNSSNNTLSELAAAINSQTSAVQASVITDANGARLAIVSTTTGAPGSLAITGTLHQTGGTAINFNQASAGENAVLTVDGVPISSASNTVSGAINGVTLNLAAPTGSTPVTLTVAPDTTDITTALNTFVSAYNTAITSITAQYQVASDGTGAGPLESDGSVRDAEQQLLAAIGYSTAGSGGSVNLTSLGITQNNDGTLSIDSSTLATALSTNFAGVVSFLQAPTTGFAANLVTTLNNVAGPGGELAQDATQYSETNADLTQQISDLQASIATQTTNLTNQYAQVNTTLEELPLLQSQLSQQLASIA